MRARVAKTTFVRILLISDIYNKVYPLCGWYVLSEESLFLESFHETLAHGLIVFLRISDVGKNLCQGFLVVDSYKFFVLFQILFLSIEVINILWRVITELLLVHDGSERQSVG